MEVGLFPKKQILQNTNDMKKFLLSLSLAATSLSASADAVIAFGNNTDDRAFTAKTILASVNGWESDVLPDGNRVAITQTPEGMGKFWNAQPVMGTWTNAAALDELNAFSGITFTAADMSQGTTLNVAANSNGQVAANLELLLDAQSPGDVVTLYTTVFGWNCPLDELTVTGLDNCIIKYAPGDGDGFSDEAVFTQVNQGLNLIKIVGEVTADKRVVVTSPTTVELGGDLVKTKVGFQIAAYKVSTPVKSVYTFAFGNNTDNRAFTAKTILASVNGWESDVLPDGNRVAITQTPAGVGKFWNAQPVMGTWTNAAALDELNAFSGITFTAADMSQGTTLNVAANSNGSVAANLELLLDAQAEGDIVTLYATLFGWNCPLDEVTVTGLDNCVVKYAPGDGEGFSDEPVFTQVNQGLNLIVITGTLTAEKRVVVTSPSAMEDGTKTKVGFQVAAYKISTPVKSVYTIAFGNNTDDRAFTAKTILASVNGWESDVLPDGNRVAITQTPEGMGKFWNAQPVMGTWTNAAALDELNAFSGITFTAADMSQGTTLNVAANSNGQVAANLELLLDAQSPGDVVTLYTTVFGWNCPLDELTVTGLDNCIIKYAPGDGDGFSDEAVFTQVNQGLNLIKIVGEVTADKRVVVTSPTTVELGGDLVKTKVGFQIAAYSIDASGTIETVIKEKTIVRDGAIYNLAGQRVKNVSKGIFIKNGRKFIVR